MARGMGGYELHREARAQAATPLAGLQRSLNRLQKSSEQLLEDRMSVADSPLPGLWQKDPLQMSSKDLLDRVKNIYPVAAN